MRPPSLHRAILSALVAGLFTLAIPAQTRTTRPAVQVFILAGQSNMEGKVQNPLLEHQAKDAKTKALFAHLRRDDQWVVRDDVFIKFLARKGGLTKGYGSRGRTGVELEFGHVLGEAMAQPIILIKAAWGGHSLFKLFRSPSAGMPSDKVLQKELEQARKRTQNRNTKRQTQAPLPTMASIKAPYGSSYRNMMKEVKDVFTNYRTMFPSLKNKSLQLAGFLWFQGWNDQYGAQDEYHSNMQHFIRDVRKDLQAPKLPFVIGIMGQNGSDPAKAPMRTIQKAQAAMAVLPEFRGSVKAVPTDILVDKAAEQLYPSWKNNQEQWKLTGSDHKYHYLGSAIWHLRMGRAFAQAMLELINQR